MIELEDKLTKYMLEDNLRTVGQVIEHFSSLGYSKQDIYDALNVFSENYIMKTTDELT